MCLFPLLLIALLSPGLSPSTNGLPVPVPLPPLQLEQGCPRSWSPLTAVGLCVKMFPEPLSFNASAQHCSNIGAELFDVTLLQTDNAEVETVISVLIGSQKCWAANSSEPKACFQLVKGQLLPPLLPFHGDNCSVQLPFLCQRLSEEPPQPPSTTTTASTEATTTGTERSSGGTEETTETSPSSERQSSTSTSSKAGELTLPTVEEPESTTEMKECREEYEYVQISFVILA